MTKLGINIDHVATLRQARLEQFPDPVDLALQACRGGAHGITAHLREDRRHIQDRDLFRLKKILPVPLNMEMSLSSSVVSVAKRLKPHWVCLVPEKREELTTEGGLNLSHSTRRLKSLISALKLQRTRISLFVDPVVSNMRKAKDLGADAVELHTGAYAQFFEKKTGVTRELEKIKLAAMVAEHYGLLVNAGHGINYYNVHSLKAIFPFHEFNIGFAIVARSLEIGMKNSVREMKQRMAR